MVRVEADSKTTYMRLEDYDQFSATQPIPFQEMVYGGLSAGFGDALIYLNVLRHFYGVTSIPLKVSRWTIETGKDRFALYRELLSAFDIRHICRISDSLPSANIDHLNPLISKRIISSQIAFLRSPLQWQPSGRRVITYQFDGVFQASQKAISAETFASLKGGTEGCKWICLGKHLSVKQNLKCLASSCCFVGIDSGIAQLAYSVGVPMVLMRNRHFFTPNHSPTMGRRAVIVDDGGAAVPVIQEILMGGKK